MTVVKRLIVLILFIFVISQLFLPAAVSKWLEGEFFSELNSPEHIEVGVSSFPAVKMFTGKIDKVYVKVDNFRYNDISFAEADFLFEDFKFKVNKLFSEESYFSLESQGKASFKMKEDDFADFLTKRLPGSKNMDVNIFADRIIINGISTAAGKDIKLEILGALKMEEGKPVFRTEEINIGKHNLDSLSIEKLKAEMTFEFDLENSKLPLEITDVFLEEGSIIIEGILEE